MIRKYISKKQAVKLASKFGVELDNNSFGNISNGGFLFKKLNEETGRETFYFLQKYFMQTFDFNYSCHKDIRKGKELIISNIPLPDIKKFL